VSQFSRNTLVELIDALAFDDDAEMTLFLIRFELEEADNHSYLSRRKISIIEYLRDHPDTIGPWGANVVVEIIEYFIETRCSYSNPLEVSFPRLARALKRDGYVVEDGKLRAMLPEELHIAEAENEFTKLLDQFGFSTTQGHFRQAVSAYTRGEWAAANAQLRACIESLFDAIAEQLLDDPAGLTTDNKLTALARLDPPFLLQNLNEWEPSGKGFVQGFRRLLHPEGAHPGLSNEEASTLRLHLVIIIASHYLRRLHARRGMG
jgi:hypothetical protein